MRSPLPLWVPIDTGPPFACPYLKDRDAKFAIGATLPTPDDFDRLMELGFRRSGRVFYRPACPNGCRACVPIRVPTMTFARSRSQRRTWRRASACCEVTVAEPRLDDESYRLYERHVERMGSTETMPTEDSYRWSFVESCVETRFFEYRVAGRLVASSVLDLGRRTASSVYCSWDEEFAALGLGTFSVLWELDWCRERGIDYYHLGYRVADCRRLAYKDRFRPFEIYDWTSDTWQPGAAD